MLLFVYLLLDPSTKKGLLIPRSLLLAKQTAPFPVETSRPGIVRMTPEDPVWRILAVQHLPYHVHRLQLPAGGRTHRKHAEGVPTKKAGSREGPPEAENWGKAIDSPFETGALWTSAVHYVYVVLAFKSGVKRCCCVSHGVKYTIHVVLVLVRNTTKLCIVISHTVRVNKHRSIFIVVDGGNRETSHITPSLSCTIY